MAARALSSKIRGENTVGGLAAGQGNLISGNVVHGIEIDSASSIGNVLLGNTIGTDITGTSPVSNGGFGISIEGTTDTIVQADLVSGNALGRHPDHRLRRLGERHLRLHDRHRPGRRHGALGNGLASQNNGIGVFVNGAAGNQIGGDGARPG